MAEDRDDAGKTEDPSQRKLEEALKRGDVVKSQEVNTWFVLGAATLVLLVFSGPMSAALTKSLRDVVANMHRIPVDGGGLLRLLGTLGAEVLAALAIPYLILFLAAVAGNVVQHKLVWSGEQLKPKLSKISLAAGARRLFSKQALAAFVKGVVKLVLIGWLMTALLWPERRRLDALVGMEPSAMLGVAYSLALAVMGAVTAALDGDDPVTLLRVADHPAPAGAEDLTGLGAVAMAQPGDGRCGVGRGWRGASQRGEPGRAVGEHGVRGDAVLAALDSNRVRQPHDGALGRGVVTAARVAEERTRRRGDDAPVPLGDEVRPRGLDHVEGAVEVHAEHGAEIGLGDLGEGPVPGGTGVADHRVHPAE